MDNTDNQLKLRAKIFNQKSSSLKIICFTETNQSNDNYHKQSKLSFMRIREFSNFSMHAQPNFLDFKSPRYNSLLCKGTASSDNPWTAATIQLLGCVWRCWYCYVDSVNLSASSKHAVSVNIDNLCDEIFKQQFDVLDLSGGQPDLVPEWLLSTHDRFNNEQFAPYRKLRSEDNLCNDFLWRFLTKSQVAGLAESPFYTRIGCFKGFDQESFTDVVGHTGSLSDQLLITQKLLESGFSPYFYATFSPATSTELRERIATFFEKLQRIEEWLPLRVVPLSLRKTTNWKRGVSISFEDRKKLSHDANQIWFELISRYFGDKVFHEELSDAL